MDGRPTWTYCDEAGDYVVPNVLSPRDLVSRPDIMDETVPHILFLIYINDLPEVITVLMKLFADDAKVYRSIADVQHVNQVQISVDKAVTWTNIWEMLFNFKKCKHLHIGSRTDPATYTMNSGTETIEIEKVNCEKDLGVIIDQALNFSKQLNISQQKSVKPTTIWE